GRQGAGSVQAVAGQRFFPEVATCNHTSQRLSIGNPPRYGCETALRKATISLSMGTPRVTFTCNTASKGSTSPFGATDSRSSSCSTKLWRQTYSTAAWVPSVVVPARINTERAGFSPLTSAITE